ncbi:cryptochrome/photolyase family protein [Sulfurivermis fontis]|uniref:cryptochrome/photolyase family protein n=1 Tax=Sulfurivermis fontis TaxID=1972068 RepID=UPI000FDC0E43|nr:deoxyribodipyrimidine photo-lyase [Sulfurivermis fontis]
MTTALLWFRRDLRLADNPALRAALAHGERVIPLYIDTPEAHNEGAAARWWLHHSLAALDASLQQKGSRLLLRRGDALEVLRAVAREGGATAVYWNRVYEPAAMARDNGIMQALRADGISVASSNALLLNEPWHLLKADGAPYRVFTPYWNAAQRRGFDLALHAAPAALPPVPAGLRSEPLEALQLLPRIRWDGGLAAQWRPGEAGAVQRLTAFLGDALAAYAVERDRPDHTGTARLSPHLHYGEVSPQRLVTMVQQRLAMQRDAGLTQNAESWLRQLAWREFAHQLLYHFPHTVNEPLDARFARFPWRRDYTEDLIAWQHGDTGIPIVDAGMRELWHSGWMHNRVRMIAASFLTKNLLIPWQEGARWFMDTLVDADLANNTLGWQWVAGCGADAAPYFRIFNPVSQGEKFDPLGNYVRRWVPELTKLPDKYVHQPWNAPQPPTHYPPPLVDLKASRERALEAYAGIKT